MTKYYNKLVRDNIPEIIEKQGKKANYRFITDEEEFRIALAAKIIEEANELAEAIRNNDKAAVLEEITDIQTLFCEIKRIYILSEAEICNNFIKKLDEKSGFYNRIFLESVEE